MALNISEEFNDSLMESIDLYVRPTITFQNLIDINNMVEDSIFEKVLYVEQHPRYGAVVKVWLAVENDGYDDLVEALRDVKGVVAIVPTQGNGNKIEEIEKFPPILRIIDNPEFNK